MNYYLVLYPYLITGEYEKAEEYYKKGLLVSPKYNPIKFFYPMILLKTKRYKEAGEFLTEYLKNNADYLDSLE